MDAAKNAATTFSRLSRAPSHPITRAEHTHTRTHTVQLNSMSHWLTGSFYSFSFLLYSPFSSSAHMNIHTRNYHYNTKSFSILERVHGESAHTKPTNTQTHTPIHLLTTCRVEKETTEKELFRFSCNKTQQDVSVTDGKHYRLKMKSLVFRY